MTVEATGKSPGIQPNIHTNNEPARKPTADDVKDGLDSLFASPGEYKNVDHSIQDLIGGRGQSVAKNSSTPTFAELEQSGANFGGTGVMPDSRYSPSHRAALAHGGLLTIEKSSGRAKWTPTFANHDPKTGDTFSRPGFAHVSSRESRVKPAETRVPDPISLSVHSGDGPRNTDPLSTGLRWTIGKNHMYGLI